MKRVLLRLILGLYASVLVVTGLLVGCGLIEFASPRQAPSRALAIQGGRLDLAGQRVGWLPEELMTPELVELDASDNRLRDLAPLRHAPNLEVLDLTHGLEYVGPLACRTGEPLWRIDLDPPPELIDLAPIGSLSQLRVLRLGGNSGWVGGMEAIKDCQELEELDLAATGWNPGYESPLGWYDTRLEALPTFPRLRTLGLGNRQLVTDLAHVSDQPALESLTFSCATWVKDTLRGGSQDPVWDFTSLKSPALRELTLIDVFADTVLGWSGVPGLESLTIRNGRVKSLQGLERLPHLRELTLVRCDIRPVSLAAMTHGPAFERVTVVEPWNLSQAAYDEAEAVFHSRGIVLELTEKESIAPASSHRPVTFQLTSN